MIEAIQFFLTAALEADPPRIDALARALDLLALAYADASSGNPLQQRDTSPGRDYTLIRSKVEGRFPALCFYAVADPLELVPEQPMVGDAVDDITDIVGDLSEALWRYTAVGPDDAHWYFRFSYETHWGRYLHDLRSYIYAKQFYGP